MNNPPRVLPHGVVAGVAGATVLAAWFFVIDLFQGEPFRTPAFVASTLFGLDGIDMSAGVISVYTLVHYVAFAAVGGAAVWVLLRTGAEPGLPFGLVLGLLLFDLVAYGGVVVTGLNVIAELGWPAVLFGNLLAGLSMAGYLSARAPRPAVPWWRTLREHRVVREGIIAGLIGAAVIALWFFFFDLAAGRALFTPAALGSTVFYGATQPEHVRIDLLTIFGYTAIHAVIFAGLGVLVAALVTAAEARPPLVFGIAMLFVIFEAGFLSIAAIRAEWLLGELRWWSVAFGNLLATLGVGWYLWRAHPRLALELRAQPYDRAD